MVALVFIAFLQIFKGDFKGGVVYYPFLGEKVFAFAPVVSGNTPSPPKDYFRFIWPDSLVNNNVNNAESISIDSLGDIYVTCTIGDMILVSTDRGNTWRISCLYPYGFGVSRSIAAGKYVFAGGFVTGILRTESGTDDWCHINNGLPTKYLWVNGFAYNKKLQTVFAVSYDGAGIYKSDNFGDMWIASDSGFVAPVFPGFTTYPIVQDIIIDTVSGCMYCCTGGFDSTGNQIGGSVWKSTNNGSSWVNVGLNGHYYVNSLAVWNGTLYAGTASSGIFYLVGDSTWQPLTRPPGRSNNIWPHALYPTKFGLLVGFSNWSIGVYLMQGTPSSPKWKYLGLAGYDPQSFAMDDSGYVYVGEQMGVWKSIMPLGKIIAALNSPPQINSFTPVSIDSVGVNTPTIFSVLATDPDGDPLTYHWKVNGLLIDSAKTDSLVYTFHTLGSRQTVTCVVADTFGAADSVMWNFKVTPVGELIPSNLTFTLSQNYPNPFNPTTNIVYTLPRKEHVKLTVYNILGQEVATLVDEEKSPGEYTVTFDGSGLPSGFYFYRLYTAGGVSETRKMILLK